jgi:Flp pilus assembly protein TadD
VDESGTTAPPAPPYELLRTSLQNVPDYGPALARLESQLERETSAGVETLHRVLLEMLADGEQPGAIHRLLGLRASQQKDWPTAVQHFEQAVRLLPTDAFLHNNLAYSLLQAQPTSEQLRRAEVMATQALQMAPDHPEILATRGEIRVRLRQYDKAVADLEKAVAVPPPQAHLYELQAECYDKLGMLPLADVCRRKAQQARSQEQRD